MQKIVILGGGYGGFTVAQHLLSGGLPHDCQLTMIDRMPFQGLKTEYYALAAGTVSELEIRVAFPDHPALERKYAEISKIAIASKQIFLASGERVDYDILIIALGCTDRYHGIPGADIYAYSIQTLSSTRRTYHAVNDLHPYAQVSIVGGGLSGVEMASELRESRPDLKIRIIDRGASILSTFPEKLQQYVKDWFHEHDVEMRSHISINRVESDGLCTASGDIVTDACVWTAGIQPVSVVQALEMPKDAQGRLLVNAHYQLLSHPEVFVIGDCSGVPFAPSAQLAEVQGKQVAHILQAAWKQQTPRLEKIKLKGVLGSLGKKSGFGMMGKRTVMMGKVPRLIKSGVLWMSKNHIG